MFFPEEKKDSLWKTKSMENLKIQFSPKRIIEDAMTIWPKAGDDVDLVADPRQIYGLQLRPGSVGVIYAFDILGGSKPSEIEPMLKRFYDFLAPGGQIYIIETNFDYICRALVGGDLKIEEFNKDFIRNSYLNNDLIVDYSVKAGFKESDMKIWYEFPGMKIQRKESQIIISALKK